MGLLLNCDLLQFLSFLKENFEGRAVFGPQKVYHILHRWNSRWLYPDFATHLKNPVHRVDIDPMLMKVKTTQNK